jgi:hypothetical protein
MATSSVNIHHLSRNNKACLQFDFIGHLDQSTADKTIKQWKTEIEILRQTSSKINLIYNCASMTGFDTNARKNWQATMKEFQSYTNTIWIVSDNIFILGAAKTMGVLTSYTIKAVRSLEDIKD